VLSAARTFRDHIDAARELRSELIALVASKDLDHHQDRLLRQEATEND
jgi:hypothetical protein